MDQETKKIINELTSKINSLEQKIKSLESSSTISIEVDSAIRERFRLSDFAQLSPSTKVALSESQTVNEAGVLTYGVLKNPDGWEERVVSGSIRYYPYWT